MQIVERERSLFTESAESLAVKIGGGAQTKCPPETVGNFAV